MPEHGQAEKCEEESQGDLLISRRFRRTSCQKRDCHSVSLCDMSSFLYYKNALASGNMVMLQESEIQIERTQAGGMSVAQAEQLSGDSFERTIVPDVLVPVLPDIRHSAVIIQQTLFYGMSCLSDRQGDNRAFIASMTCAATESPCRDRARCGLWLIYIGKPVHKPALCRRFRISPRRRILLKLFCCSSSDRLRAVRHS